MFWESSDGLSLYWEFKVENNEKEGSNRKKKNINNLVFIMLGKYKIQ